MGIEEAAGRRAYTRLAGANGNSSSSGLPMGVRSWSCNRAAEGDDLEVNSQSKPGRCIASCSGRQEPPGPNAVCCAVHWPVPQRWLPLAGRARRWQRAMRQNALRTQRQAAVGNSFGAPPPPIGPAAR